MKKLALLISAVLGLLSGCVAYDRPYGDRGDHHDEYRGDSHEEHHFDREHEHEHDRDREEHHSDDTRP